MVRTEEVIYLDTNVMLALERGDLRLYSREARRLLDRDKDILISPMVFLELELLYEIKRTRATARVFVEALSRSLGLRVCKQGFADVAFQAAQEAWTRDPFDRMIAAQARLAKSALITRDIAMLKNYSKALC